MKYILPVTGVLAGLAIAAPDLVVLGYFFLILPGLVLNLAPTVFVYLAVTAIVRHLLPISSPMLANATAFGVSLLLGWCVMQPFRLQAIATYRAEELLDVLPNQAIELGGHVRIERPNQRLEPECDYLSLALLDSQLVESLTTVTAGRGKTSGLASSAAYALVSANTDPAAGIFPSEPGQIVREYPPLAQTQRGIKLSTAAKAVEAEWAIRLAGPERLRKVAPVEAGVADWVIQIENQTGHPTSVLQRVTILDSKGNVRYRKSYRKQAVAARMFYFGFHASMTGDSSFYVGRQVLESGQRSLKPESALLEAIRFRVPQCHTDALEQLRDQALQALDDPEATLARLDLPRRYLGLFFFDANEQDRALIARIIADDRVREIEPQIKNIFSKDRTPERMRDAYLERIAMDHTSASLRHWLAKRLASLPAGTFADSDPTYLAIWNSPEICQDAAPLIATLADLGPEHGMPKIERILDDALELPHWRERRGLMEGVRAALIRFGPQASAAAPRIRELFLRRPSPIMNNSDDADQWRFALARMGVALEDLPVFPNQSPQSVERNMRRVSEKLRRYEQEHVKGDRAVTAF